MERIHILHILAFLWASVAVLAIPALVYGGIRLYRKLRKKSPTYTKNTVSSILLFSGFLLFAVWCLRYAVGFFAIYADQQGAQSLTWWEEIVNSVLHALQTFSMDENYTEYLIDGKRMLAAICGESSAWITLYSVYVSALNCLAPIAGGAVIFEILASIFPRIKLFFLRWMCWREKYYFSELNEASLALAKSVRAAKMCWLKRPVIVFTDAYVDKEDEKSSELLLEAKALGAICTRDDLSHIRKNGLGHKSYFLIDQIESNNLQTLATLANTDHNACLKKAQAFLFTNDDAYVQVEENVRRQLREDWGYTEDEVLPFSLVPVLSYRNLISNMLVDIPLYEPLIGKKKDENGVRTLTVSILGTGHIGTEMFLSTYWFGQMLDVDLKINVLSQETEEQFWGKINYINPEIRLTTMPQNETLRIYPKAEDEDVEKVFSNPYCSVKYGECDVKSSQFVEYLTSAEENILDTDYYLVALGSDADNISVANTLRQYVGQHHIHMQAEDTVEAQTNPAEVPHTVITYVVYDSELSQTLNTNCFHSVVPGATDIYMRAVGSLEDVNSMRTVFMTEYAPFVEQVHARYLERSHRQSLIKKHSARTSDDYKHWANMARKMHLKYKLYSAGLIKETDDQGVIHERSMFDYATDKQGYDALMEKACAEYKNLPEPDNKTYAWSENVTEEQKHFLNRLAWLEHRRWCAFTRIKGFRHTAAYDVYARYKDVGSYKQMDLKLHPCLVECDDLGMRERVFGDTVTLPKKKAQTEKKCKLLAWLGSLFGKKAKAADETYGLQLWKYEEDAVLDLLDILSQDLFAEDKLYNCYDFKVYDYPSSDF